MEIDKLLLNADSTRVGSHASPGEVYSVNVQATPEMEDNLQVSWAALKFPQSYGNRAEHDH